MDDEDSTDVTNSYSRDNNENDCNERSRNKEHKLTWDNDDKGSNDVTNSSNKKERKEVEKLTWGEDNDDTKKNDKEGGKVGQGCVAIPDLSLQRRAPEQWQ